MADKSILNNRLLIYQFKIGKLINRLDKLALIIISKCFSNYKYFFNDKDREIENLRI